MVITHVKNMPRPFSDDIHEAFPFHSVVFKVTVFEVFQKARLMKVFKGQPPTPFNVSNQPCPLSGKIAGQQSNFTLLHRDRTFSL